MSSIDQSDIDELTNRALQHFARQDLEQAVALWRSALELSPDHTQTHVYLATALRSQGDNNAAARHYERALQLQPEMAVVHYNLGNIRQEQGALEQAIACYKIALDRHPDFALAAYNLANIHRDQGRLSESIEYYNKSISNDPMHAPSYNNLGKALKYQGNLALAMASYEKALELQPDYPDAMYNRGNAFFEMQDFSNAMTCFDRAGIHDAPERALYCSYKTLQFDDFRSRLHVLQQTREHHSPQVAALVAHHAVSFHSDNSYGFCPRPFDFLYHESVPELAAADSSLRRSLLQNIRHGQIGEGRPGRLHDGVQSIGNLLYRDESSISALADLVRDHFDRYLARYKDEGCELIRAFPHAREFESSWYIRMHRGGYLSSHIHESGWISGAVYLTLPQRPEGSDEGCFELSVQGDDYPVVEGAGEFPSQTLTLAVGDIVLFPANLFHSTVPFQADEERICIAFDLKPIKPDTAKSTHE